MDGIDLPNPLPCGPGIPGRIIHRIVVAAVEVEINGKQIVRGKPDPWIFVTAAERLNLKPEECIVFEDAVLGVEAGKRGGMFTIGIDRRGAPERLKKADLVIGDLGEVDYKKLNSFIK